MNAPAFENLDLACAKVGKAIAKNPPKDLENLITSALAVLEEQGVYALFLYLKAQGNETGHTVSVELYNFLKNIPQKSSLLSKINNDIFAALQELGENLDNLLLARDLVRQSLVYARYHAKLREKEKTSS